ncbi:DUF4340 domain-containing protein [Flavivirga rizhaonensis]|uniref:DUF4340 domain-containing protein n=1 Tax=Flavivirga rizhaonensis TaxID=2559571 RepID=A0A4S1E2W6_9FLAO|nr:DUF4340 domain-containing protein [Flavivirga rizhaonensis]TGV04693.1 DUF4340 domain-containing protein [Flavivirga rizhaonensis]
MKKNSILIAVLIGLVLLFVATNYFKKTSSVNFKSEVIRLDSSQVKKIIIRPSLATKEEPIIISNENDSWEVAQGTIKTKANQSTVKNALGELEQIKTEQLVAKTKDKWGAYQLTDSLAQCVEIHERDKEQATKLYLGKTTYKQSQNPGYGGRPSMDATTYFRIKDNPKTYATKSGLSNTFKRKFNTWRNSEFIKVDKDLITQLKFETGDKDFSLAKKDSVWTMGMLSTDSTKVAQYLNTVQNQSSSQFVDGFTPKDKADYKLTIQSNSMADLIVKAYRDSTGNKFIMNSSQHPNVFVESDSTGLFKRLFVNHDHFSK